MKRRELFKGVLAAVGAALVPKVEEPEFPVPGEFRIATDDEVAGCMDWLDGPLENLWNVGSRPDTCVVPPETSYDWPVCGLMWGCPESCEQIRRWDAGEDVPIGTYECALEQWKRGTGRNEWN